MAYQHVLDKKTCFESQSGQTAVGTVDRLDQSSLRFSMNHLAASLECLHSLGETVYSVNDKPWRSGIENASAGLTQWSLKHLK